MLHLKSTPDFQVEIDSGQADLELRTLELEENFKIIKLKHRDGGKKTQLNGKWKNQD